MRRVSTFTFYQTVAVFTLFEDSGRVTHPVSIIEADRCSSGSKILALDVELFLGVWFRGYGLPDESYPDSSPIETRVLIDSGIRDDSTWQSHGQANSLSIFRSAQNVLRFFVICLYFRAFGEHRFPGTIVVVIAP